MRLIDADRLKRDIVAGEEKHLSVMEHPPIMDCSMLISSAVDYIDKQPTVVQENKDLETEIVDGREAQRTVKEQPTVSPMTVAQFLDLIGYYEDPEIEFCLMQEDSQVAVFIKPCTVLDLIAGEEIDRIQAAGRDTYKIWLKSDKGDKHESEQS